MKKTTTLSQKFMLFFLLVFSLIGYGQHFTVTLDNFTSTTNTFEVDVILIVDSPAEGVRLCAVQAGINYNPAILDGGFPCSPTNCGSWSMIEGTTSPELTANGGLNPWRLTTRYPYGHLRTLQLGNGNSLVDLLPGTYRVGRFKLENTVPWAQDSDPALWLQPYSETDFYFTRTAVSFKSFGGLGSQYCITYTTNSINPSNEPGLTLGYTQEAPLLRVLNSSLATVSVNASSNIATAFPNPFSSSFKLNLTTVSSEVVQVGVYDMLGKLIEDFKVENNGISSFSFGEKYATGFYNVKVVQGDKTQVIRMIKQ